MSQDDKKNEELDKAFELIELAHNEIDALVDSFKLIEDLGSSELFQWKPEVPASFEEEVEKLH